MATRTVWERVEAGGTRVVEVLKNLIAEGNIRRVRVRQQGRVIAEFPLTVGVIGTVFAPMLAAIGAITALLTECAIEVERVVEDTETAAPDESAAPADPASAASPPADQPPSDPPPPIG